MKKIWKFVLEITGRQTVSVPAGAQMLSVANQNGLLCLWVLVDPDVVDRVDRTIDIFGTGTDISPLAAGSRSFIGSVVMDPFVWHVFAVE